PLFGGGPSLLRRAGAPGAVAGPGGGAAAASVALRGPAACCLWAAPRVASPPTAGRATAVGGDFTFRGAQGRGPLPAPLLAHRRMSLEIPEPADRGRRTNRNSPRINAPMNRNAMPKFARATGRWSSVGEWRSIRTPFASW